MIIREILILLDYYK